MGVDFTNVLNREKCPVYIMWQGPVTYEDTRRSQDTLIAPTTASDQMVFIACFDNTILVIFSQLTFSPQFQFCKPQQNSTNNRTRVFISHMLSLSILFFGHSNRSFGVADWCKHKSLRAV